MAAGATAGLGERVAVTVGLRGLAAVLEFRGKGEPFSVKKGVVAGRDRRSHGILLTGNFISRI